MKTYFYSGEVILTTTTSTSNKICGIVNGETPFIEFQLIKTSLENDPKLPGPISIYLTKFEVIE